MGISLPLPTVEDRINTAKHLLIEAQNAVESGEDHNGDQFKTDEELQTYVEGRIDEAFKQREFVNKIEGIHDLEKSLTTKDAPQEQWGYVNPVDGKFQNNAHFLIEVWKAGDVSGRYRNYVNQDLVPLDGNVIIPHTGKTGWADQTKQLVESVGSSGGFLVPTEFRAQLLRVTAEMANVRARATIIPMARRSVLIPVLDQTNTAVGTFPWAGGIVATWTEEATEKALTEPEFRQIELTAHELVCYTRASDTLLADSALSLEAILVQGFSEAIALHEELAFVNGTGAGQPLGVLQALAALTLGPTLTVARTAAGAIGIQDIFNMLQVFLERPGNPVWMITRSAFSQIMGLQGPAANPSFQFITNAVDSPAQMLMGYPIIWSEMMPTLGNQGDILLANWRFYLVGDRQQTTIDSTNAEFFRWNQTSWRAVHRVDGQPWMSAPITYRDGNTQVSPFVILGDVAAT